MDLRVSVPEKIESALRQRAAAAGKDFATFVGEILIEEVADDSSMGLRAHSHEDFVSRLRGIIELHGVSNGKMDDSRESIYAGRGE